MKQNREIESENRLSNSGTVVSACGTIVDIWFDYNQQREQARLGCL